MKLKMGLLVDARQNLVLNLTLPKRRFLTFNKNKSWDFRNPPANDRLGIFAKAQMVKAIIDRLPVIG